MTMAAKTYLGSKILILTEFGFRRSCCNKRRSQRLFPILKSLCRAFPDVQSLAAASIDDVMHHWSGLGYYSRAKNLHKAACMLVDDFGGEFPDTVEEVTLLPGIGRSTAGAIISIALQKRAAILDGNVKRVLARYHAVEGWPGKTSVLNALWEKAEMHTPDKRCNHYTQAMMDLGATVCKRSKPLCDVCPVQADCQAYAENRQTDFPGKKPKKDLPVKATQMVVIRHGDDIMLNKRPLTGIWPGLMEFYRDRRSMTTLNVMYKKHSAQRNLRPKCSKALGIPSVIITSILKLRISCWPRNLS